ncbi:MAG TPA: hypothetical protein VFR67_22885, partial [Pilimelia sp.]|nr:hypothetical protein [Pilimelia sp.]
MSEPEHITELLTPTGEPILTAMLRVPGTPAWAVERQRLLDRVSRGADGVLTLVTAPAGSGKTVLLSSWVAGRHAPGPVAWVTVDPRHDEPGMLWSYVIAAFIRAGIPVGDVGFPARPDRVEESWLIRLAACLSEQRRPVVLVLDYANALDGSRTTPGIESLLRHTGPQLRLIILSRVVPDLPVHRYRVAGTVVEIRLEQLAFTTAEAHALLVAHGLELRKPDLVTLVQSTKGWAAGLRLAALSLQDAWPADGRIDCDDVRSDIEDYFVAEVLDPQPAGVRDFLLRTSVADRMWPGLVAELCDDPCAPRTLAALAHGNISVLASPVDRHSFEYHPIVRDLLHTQLKREVPNEVCQLHRKAAHWLADAGRYPDAIVQHAAAGDWEDAARLLVDNLVIGQLISGPQAGRLGAALGKLPPDLGDPAVAVAAAAAALSGQDTELCAKHLLRANELVDAGAVETGAALRLSAAATAAVCARMRGEGEAALAAVSTADTAIDEHAYAGHDVPSDLRALLLLNKGQALFRGGELDSAAQALAEALATAESPGGDHLLLDCFAQLALIEALNGNLRRATYFARRAGMAVEQLSVAGEGTDDLPPIVDLALAWIRAEEYDVASARDHADRAAEAPESRRDPVIAGLLAVVRARLLRARGNVTGAVRTILRSRGAFAESMPDWLLDHLESAEAALGATGAAPAFGRSSPPAGAASTRPHAALAWARSRLHDGAPGDAAAVVNQVLARPGMKLNVRVDAWLLTATCEL